ncbi:MAG: hypothetical protein QW678_02075 [Candidatus Aenigmatarchaeota archaeon]
MNVRNEIKKILNILFEVPFAISSIKEIVSSVIDKKINRDLIVIYGENHLSELDAKIISWLIKRLKPYKVLSEGYILKSEDLREVEGSIEDFKKEFIENMKEIGTIKYYLETISDRISEEERQKLENIISEILKRYSIKNKRKKYEINIDTNLFDLNGKEFYNLRKFVEESINSFIYEKLDTDIEKYLTYLSDLYKYLELLIPSRIIYRLTIRDFYIKEAILKVGSEEKIIDNNEHLREELNKAYNENNIELIRYINNLREREMAYEIMKSVEELKREFGKYRILVIVGAAHAKNIREILKNNGIKNVRVVSNLYIFDLDMSMNIEYYNSEYEEFQLKIDKLLNYLKHSNKNL